MRSFARVNTNLHPFTNLGFNVGEQVPITITVTKDDVVIDPGNGPTTGDGEDDKGFIPGFEVITLLGAAVTGLVLHSFKRRR